MLVFNAISFSYWGDTKWTIDYHGEKFDGAWGMIASIGKAIEDNKPILKFDYLKDISKKDFEEILHGNVKIPLFEERLNILREIGSILSRNFQGEFINLVKKVNNDALRLLELILKTFPSFNDNSLYKGKKIFFQKRAQLLVADIYQMFNGEGFGKLKNIQEITACADYKLPMVLRNLGILKYSKQLGDKIDKRIELNKNSEEEIEIRANTIWANEFIKIELRKRIKNINSVHINDHLWLLGQLRSAKHYHLTRTIAY